MLLVVYVLLLVDFMVARELLFVGLFASCLLVDFDVVWFLRL